MEYFRGRATRSPHEELTFFDATSDPATVISVEEFFDVQDDDGDHVEVDTDDDLSFIDDLSFFSQEEPLGGRAVTPSPPRQRPSAGATAFAPTPAPAPVRDVSNSPRTVTVVANNDFVADDCVDIIGGKYKGKTGTVIKRTPARVRVKLDGANYSTKEPVNLVPHNISRQGSSRRTGNIDDAKLSSPRTVSNVTNDDFVTGDRVEIIGGKYKDKTGTVVKRTPARVQVKLDGADYSTKNPVNLVPHNVSHRDSSRRTGSVNDTKPVLQTPTEFLIPSDMSISLGDADRSDGDSHDSRLVRTVDSAQHGRSQRHPNVCSSGPLEPPQTTPSPSPTPPWSPWSATAPVQIESKAAGWLVPGGEDSMLHSSLGLREDYRRLLSPNGKSDKESTFAFHLFGHRIVSFKVPHTVETLPSEYLEDRGDKRSYHLLTTKLQKPKASRAGMFKPAEITAHYVLVEGGGIRPINLQEELEKVAAFGRLKPGKVAARLELFQSTSQKSNSKKQDYLVFGDLTSSDFETIPEIANEGCGYIPRDYIQRFLGNNKIGKRTCALQVRVFASGLGVFKGVLFEKAGIKKIQLPSSMQKVGPSETEDVVDKACVLINGRFPSSNNVHVASLLAGEVPPESFHPQRPSEMMLAVLEALSVPRAVLDEYAEASHGDRGRGLEHASCIGVADPTGLIPPGHVFVTGIRNTSISQNELFVSRFPCTEAADGRLLPVVRSKPLYMSESSWEWMNGLHFGVVIFGNPWPGCAPLPETVAGGDLDGDLYFICWNHAILSSIDNSFDLVEDMSVANSTPSEAQAWNENWLRDGQDVMRNIKAMTDHHTLIGKLYSSMDKADTSSDALWFGRAYKEAIDIGKHGGLVKLPAHLWEHLPERFHMYLTK